VCLGFASIYTVSMAEPLAKSGTINIHTGWKISPEVFEAPEKRSVGHGSVVGVNFNDNGSGPLHNGPAICVFTFLGSEAGPVNKGFCAFGDADGDRIFTDWDGKGNDGTNRIAGGTGKYRAITGNGPWMCWDTPTPAALRCTQRFDYQLS
jgi:hypothetical protein